MEALEGILDGAADRTTGIVDQNINDTMVGHHLPRQASPEAMSERSPK